MYPFDKGVSLQEKCIVGKNVVFFQISMNVRRQLLDVSLVV